MELENFEITELDEIKAIADEIRSNKFDDKLEIYVNSFAQIILQLEIENYQTIGEFMYIMDNIKNIQLLYLPEFESSFEIWRDDGRLHIYCTYERNKIN